MNRNLFARILLFLGLGLSALAGPRSSARAQEKATVPAGGTVNISVSPAVPATPAVSFTLFERHGHVTPIKGKHTHTGGGLIDVATPSADTIVITMTGAVVANSEMKFDLDQCFQVNFDDPKVKAAKLTVEGRVIGLLRSHCKGNAGHCEACATVRAGAQTLVNVCVPPHGVSGGENMTVNCHEGPVSAIVGAGKLNLHQAFGISAHSDCILVKRPSAEFAPDPALEPLWISSTEPFHGIIKKDLGFQVTIKISAEEDKKEEKNGK